MRLNRKPSDRPLGGRLLVSFRLFGTACLLAGLAAAVAARAQQAPTQGNPDDFRLSVETDLVVLYATIINRDGRPVTDLQREHFKVYEDKVEQQLKIFKQEDIPVSIGLLVDNSGSMRDKRRGVNTAALKFVRASNPEDEVFIVNFNDESYLDTDFTDSVKLLEEGLERIDSRGGTAFYDALHLALAHLTEKASWDKKVLLLITDGEDNASRITLEQLVQNVERSDVMIYTVGLLGGESSRSMRRAKRALENIAKASGGSTYFPKSLEEVQVVANHIADDIRNQYVLAYTPTNAVLDGKFRKVEVKLSAPRKYGRLTVRSRGGYYAESKTAQPKPAPPEQSSGL
jgi:VWFA-related protein